MIDITDSFDSSMRSAYEELKPHWQRHCDGEISKAEYYEIREAVFAKWGI